MTKFKIQNKSKIQNPKQTSCYLCFVIWIYFVICASSFGFVKNAYALDLDKLKVSFLNGDYKEAINEGERMLGQGSEAAHSDELYYFLGLSYLKDGNFLRASDIFEIILQEFKYSAFTDKANLGLGDVFFLQGDYEKAESYYKKINLNDNRLSPCVYYRLSQCALKTGNTSEAEKYLSTLKEKFPANPELINNVDICPLPLASSQIYYTVQVGVFVNSANARSLVERLIQNGYPAYIEEIRALEKTSYRVRVGKFTLLSQAQDTQSKLAQEGYPTKIFP